MNNDKWKEYADYRCMKGDRVTCTVDRVTGCVSFSINGQDKGKAFENIEEIKEGELYFAVSLYYKGCSLRIVD